MATTALQQLIDLQRSMYDRAMADARESSGLNTSRIASYHKDFESSLPNKFTQIPVRKILENADRNPILLFGDFHSHKQCQRAFLRILRMYNNRPDHAPIVVAMEMFRSKDQAHVNAWLGGHINDTELLDLIDYDKTWGFPWNNYKSILEYCRSENIPVVGINTAKSGKDSLDKRDRHAADVIAAVRKSAPTARVFCMVGEFHLADGKLPSIISEMASLNKRRPIRIFANLDKYFFALKPDRLHRQDEYLDLGMESFCVINSAPWVKWQTQALWEELRSLGQISYLANELAPDDGDDFDSYDDDPDLFSDDVLDLDYHLVNLQKQLAGFIKISAGAEITDRYHIITSKDKDGLEQIPTRQRGSFLERASRDGFAVDYLSRLVYMPEITINHMASAAGQMLFGGISSLEEPTKSRQHLFVATVLKYAYGFIANKILNPRIPLRNLRQIDSYVLQTRGKRLAGPARQRRETARETVKIFNWILDEWVNGGGAGLKPKEIPAVMLNSDIKSHHEIARNIAQIIANPICVALIKGRIDTTDIKKIVTSSCSTENAARKTLAAFMQLSNL